ncbi:MAG: hypothetical protein HDQ90_01900 [Desulfovibrio sp.]|nr:hypothetical protein [Desulfovibrio sp.]
MKQMEGTYFIYIADVFCPWCYAFAPVMKKLAGENPDIPVRVLGGNLISRPMTLAEDAAQSPGLVDFWHEVEHASGRSLAGAISAVETGREVRLFSPGADEILAVLKKMAPGHELEQLFELEELFYGQGRDMFTDAALAEIAGHWGIDPAHFASALDQPAALAATERNLEMAAELMGEITSYPSVLLVRGDRYDAVSRGFVHYETVAARLADAMRDLGVPLEESAFCSRHNGCSLRRR